MKRLITLAAAAIVALSMLPEAGAAKLLDQDEALKEVLGTTKFEKVEKSISQEEGEKVAKQIEEEAGRLLPQGHDVRVPPTVEFYFPEGKKDDTVAVIMKEPGKWGPIEFAVALDAKTGESKDLVVMSYSEKRGRPIARNNFLRQFKGNPVDEPLLIGRGIRGISGATVSSWAAAVVVRKAQLVYKAAFLEDEKAE